MFADIPGATATTFTTPPLSLADVGSRYRVVVSLSGRTGISSEATLLAEEPPALHIVRSGAGYAVSGAGLSTLEEADRVNGPWTSVANASSPHIINLSSSVAKFYRIRR